MVRLIQREIYLSECSIIIPVIKWVGMSEVSMSTVNICDVSDSSPPRLYKSCLHKLGN